MSLAPVEIEFTDLSEFDEPAIPCDGHKIWPDRLPEHDDPAEWIGLKRCGHHRLLCTRCKDLYVELTPFVATFTCATCGAEEKHETSLFLGFEPLVHKS